MKINWERKLFYRLTTPLMGDTCLGRHHFQSLRHLLVPIHFSLVLMTTLLGGCDDHPPNANLTSAVRSELTEYALAMDFLANDCGPERITPDTVIGALRRDPGWPGWKGPYMDADFYMFDRWETPWKIVRSGNKMQIISAGPDRKFGTDDDIIATADLPEKGHLKK
jgi:hypothetical protein